MLILTRKEGEEVLIGEKIRVLVSEIEPGRVKLGFTAPHSLNIVRAELANGPAARPDDHQFCRWCNSWHPVPRDREHWKALQCQGPAPVEDVPEEVVEEEEMPRW